MQPIFQFSPSLLAYSHSDHEALIQKLVSAKVTAMHIDVMDGTVTPTKGLDPQIMKMIPESTIVDVHIMSEHPLEILKTLPARKNTYVHTHLSMCPEYQLFISTATALGFMPGITIGMDDDLNCYTNYIDQLKWVNFMSVYQIGRTNQVFAEAVYERIGKFQSKYHQKYITAIDGSVRIQHLRHLHGMVNYVIIGSLLFNSSNYEAQIKTLFNSIK